MIVNSGVRLLRPEDRSLRYPCTPTFLSNGELHTTASYNLDVDPGKI